MRYFGNYAENAVIREDGNGKCVAKLWSPIYPKGGSLVPEYPLRGHSEMRYGTIEYDVEEITEAEYDTFGKSWIFGSTFRDRVTI